MRGVWGDLARRGAKEAAINTVPVTLVRKTVFICSVMEPGTKATAALLTRASILEGN